MFFVAIMGGGPAGYTAGAELAKNGKSVIVFEKEELGGTCLNVGCIPTKTLLYSAKQFCNAQSEKYGIKAENVAFDWDKMQQRKDKIIRKLRAGVKQQLTNCTVIKGAATVVERTDEKVIIECNGEQYTAEKLLICTGSSNFVPPIDGIENNPNVWDSTAALQAKELPQSIAIIGGGVIGMEFATLFAELGVEVSVVEFMPNILPNIDEQISNLLKDKYQKQGIHFYLQNKVTAINGNTLTIENHEGETTTLTADKILLSVGRRPNLNGLENLGLKINKGIEVDDFMRTNLQNVYAVGDVTSKIMLAHVATQQAEIAVKSMLNEPTIPFGECVIPSVVYTNPEIATVGINEQTANQLGGYIIKSIPMSFSGRFVAENEGENGLCKVILEEKTNVIKGVHLFGNVSSEIIATATMAIQQKMTIEQLKQIVFPHPTVSEIIKECL